MDGQLALLQGCNFGRDIINTRNLHAELGKACPRDQSDISCPMTLMCIGTLPYQ